MLAGVLAVAGPLGHRPSESPVPHTVPFRRVQTSQSVAPSDTKPRAQSPGQFQ